MVGLPSAGDIRVNGWLAEIVLRGFRCEISMGDNISHLSGNSLVAMTNRWLGGCKLGHCWPQLQYPASLSPTTLFSRRP